MLEVAVVAYNAWDFRITINCNFLPKFVSTLNVFVIKFLQVTFQCSGKN